MACVCRHWFRNLFGRQIHRPVRKALRISRITSQARPSGKFIGRRTSSELFVTCVLLLRSLEPRIAAGFASFNENRRRTAITSTACLSAFHSFCLTSPPHRTKQRPSELTTRHSLYRSYLDYRLTRSRIQTTSLDTPLPHFFIRPARLLVYPKNF
jgi:hypothetical protein